MENIPNSGKVIEDSDKNYLNIIKVYQDHGSKQEVVEMNLDRLDGIEKNIELLTNMVSQLETKTDQALRVLLAELQRQYQEHSDIQDNMINELNNDNIMMAQKLAKYEKREECFHEIRVMGVPGGDDVIQFCKKCDTIF